MTMDFMTALRTCVVQKYATFSGRASRSEYWWFFLAVFVGSVFATLLGPLSILFTLAVLCPLLSAGFRRLQDTGRPGWWIVIPAGLSILRSIFTPDVPDEAAVAAVQLPNMDVMIFSGLFGLISLTVTAVFVWFLTRPSQPETNAYGPPPQAAS